MLVPVLVGGTRMEFRHDTFLLSHPIKGGPDYLTFTGLTAPNGVSAYGQIGHPVAAAQ